MTKGTQVSNKDYDVLLKVYEHSYLNGENVYMSKLQKLCGYSGNQLDKSVHTLNDLGVLQSELKRVGCKKEKCIFVAEDYVAYVSKLYDKINEMFDAHKLSPSIDEDLNKLWQSILKEPIEKFNKKLYQKPHIIVWFLYKKGF